MYNYIIMLTHFFLKPLPEKPQLNHVLFVYYTLCAVC